MRKYKLTSEQIIDWNNAMLLEDETNWQDCCTMSVLNTSFADVDANAAKRPEKTAKNAP